MKALRFRGRRELFVQCEPVLGTDLEFRVMGLGMRVGLLLV